MNGPGNPAEGDGTAMTMTRRTQRGITLGGVAAASLVAGMLLSSRLSLTEPTRAESGGAVATAVAALPAEGSTGFVRIAEEEKRFVVNINTTKSFRHRLRRRAPGPQGPRGPEDFFGDDFFERFFGQVPEQELKQQSLGTGFIIDKDGWILTNNHVVDGADDVRVTLLDGRSYAAEVKGRDPKTDIALIKIEPDDGLPAARLGDSDALQVAEPVMAIGNPFGLGHTVTVGVVSAKERSIGMGPYDAFIQTDASINPGNSGGPLINTRGEVVGINSAIYASGQGLGFAIPINIAKGIVDQLRETGTVTRGWLGVQIQELTPELRETLRAPGKGGALVAGVVAGDPAEKGGIKAGDVIVSFDGKEVRSDRDLVAIVGNTEVGRTVKVRLVRDGKEKTLEVKIARRDDEKDAAADEDDGAEEPSGKARLGVRVQDLTPELAERLGLDEPRGALVAEVESGGPADRAGITRGDVVLEVNREPVKDASSFAKAVRGSDPDKTLLLLVRGRGGTRFVAVKPEPKDKD